MKINILSTEDNLQEYLQYSHKKQGDAGYTGGLPTDAGTYDVIVSLPEMQNFEAAVSDPLTLIINKISPIATEPAAIKPVYNGAEQELVTAGTLDPAAIADGLEIKFAAAENGTYSTAIPTGTTLALPPGVAAMASTRAAARAFKTMAADRKSVV